MSDANIGCTKKLICYDLRQSQILEYGARVSGIRQMSANRGASCCAGLLENYGTISKGIAQAFAAYEQIPDRFIP